MRFFRLMAMGVVLLVLAGAILGTACAGARGEQGPQGETGATGATGTTGPQGPQGEQGIQGIQGPQGLPGVGIAWRGEWSNSIAYGISDAVGYQGSSYVSKQNGNTNHVPTDMDWWDLWVAKGDTGAQGIQGIPGAAGATGATGAQGPQGIQGAAGAQGIQGEPGPNMIVAMGNTNSDGTLNQGYNVTSCIWDAPFDNYVITLTGISYVYYNYVTLVTCVGSSSMRTATYGSGSGKLQVFIYDDAGNPVQAGFSFMVLDTTP